MRHILLILLALAFGGVLRAQSPDEAWLEGTLVSKTDKTPLVNAFVVLRTADGADTPFSAITDEKGYFLLKATTGTYRLAATFVQQTIILRPSLELLRGGSSWYASHRADPRAGGGRRRGEDSPCTLRRLDPHLR